MAPLRSRELMTPQEVRDCLRATDERHLPEGAGALVVGPLLGLMLWALAVAAWAAWPSFVAAWGMR